MGAHKTAQFIPDLIAKFLNFQAFIKTASPLTLKAYELDLTQAYGLQSIGKFLRPGDWDLKQTALNPSFKSKNAPIEASVEYRFRAASGPQATRDARLNPKIRSSARIRPKSVARLDSGSISSYYLSSDAELLKLSREAQTRWAQLSSASRNRKAACLKSFLHFLYQEGEIETDLGLQIHTPKVAVRMPNFLSVDEALALIKSIEAAEKKAADEDSLAQARRDLALILLLYGGGLRVSEACALRWQDIDANRRILKVKGKGGKERLVALTASCVDANGRETSKWRQAAYVWGTDALGYTQSVRNCSRLGSTREPC